MTPDIRWLIRRDMDAVLAIEKACFEFAWTEEDFLCCLRQRSCIGMVVEQDGSVVEFVIYELYRTNLRIVNFAVCPAHRREGIGTAIIDRLKDTLAQQRRTALITVVRERNLPAQTFFSHQGFIATGLLREHYNETEEDGIEFMFCLPTQASAN